MCCELQHLEPRRLLSVSVTTAGGILRIVGDAADQSVAITDTRASREVFVSVDADGDGTNTNDPEDLDHKRFTGIRAFDLSLKRGDDTVDFVMVDSYSRVVRSLRVDLGDGDDSFTFSQGGGSTLINTRFSVDVKGGFGDDEAMVDAPAMRQSSQFSARLDMGDGNDLSSLRQPFFASATGKSRASFELTAGAGDDDATANFAARVADGSEVRYSAAMGTGNDSFSGDVNYQEFDVYAASRLSVDVRGEAGRDALVMGASGTVDAETFTVNEGRIQVSLDGGIGNDRTDVLLGRMILNRGTFSVRTRGGNGADTALVDLRTSPRSTRGVIDVFMRGDAGNDALAISIDDAAGNSTFAPNGFCRLDGGAGIDSVEVSGNGKVKTQRFEP